MDDRIRVSDADRERVTTRLRDHFAEGRLTSDELDERITQALNAKTFGDLRRVMADLPEPAPPPRPAAAGRQAAPPWAIRRGPRLLPLVLIALFAAVAFGGPGGWVMFGFLRLLLVLWLVACLIGLFGARRFRRRMHDRWHHGYHGPGGRYPWV